MPTTATLKLDPATRDAMLASLGSLKQVAELGVDVLQLALERTGVDLSSLAALRTDDLVISFEPSQRLLDLVAAISARDFDSLAVEVEICHGWPILSLGALNTPSVAEAGGVTSAPGGGLAA